MIEVVLEDGWHILYQDGERFNYLTSTTVVQDSSEHRPKECEVSATVLCWGSGQEIDKEKPSMYIEHGKLYTPNGKPVPCIEKLSFAHAPVEDAFTAFTFTVKAKLK